MTTSVPPAVALEHLIESGAFAPQATVEERYAATFADCVEPIAHGIVALAKAKDDSLVDITECPLDIYGSISPERGLRSKFIVFNSAIPAGGGMQLPGGSTFSVTGELGFRAAILETGYAFGGSKTELSLVLPAWGTGVSTVGLEATPGVGWAMGRYAPKAGDIVIVKFDTTGHAEGDRYRPYTRTEDGVAVFTDADVFLKHLLGMDLIKGQDVTSKKFSGTLNPAIGFPGAEKYLAEKLPELGAYFVALAEKLAAQSR